MVAHPDDESFGLGAVIDMLAAGGTAALILCYTRVSRKRQRHAALLHSSQISPAAVLWRRLQLQGEWRAPALARPARGGRHVPAVRRGRAGAGYARRSARTRVSIAVRSPSGARTGRSIRSARRMASPPSSAVIVSGV